MPKTHSSRFSHNNAIALSAWQRDRGIERLEENVFRIEATDD